MYLGNRGVPDDGLRDVYAKEMMDPIGGGGSAWISLNPEPILKILPRESRATILPLLPLRRLTSRTSASSSKYGFTLRIGERRDERRPGLYTAPGSRRTKPSPPRWRIWSRWDLILDAVGSSRVTE